MFFYIKEKHESCVYNEHNIHIESHAFGILNRCISFFYSINFWASGHEVGEFKYRPIADKNEQI